MSAKRFKENPEKQRAATRASYARHRWINQIASRAKYYINIERERVRSRAYAKLNRDKARARARRWSKTPKGKAYAREKWRRPETVASARRWAQANPERVKGYQQKYTRNNPEKVKAKARTRRAREQLAVATLTLSQWEKILKKYRGICAYCRLPTDAPTQDHVVALAKGGHHTASNVVPACSTCNSRKGTLSVSEFKRKWRL